MPANLLSSTANYVRLLEGAGAFAIRPLSTNHIVKKRQVHYSEEFVVAVLSETAIGYTL